MTLPVNITNAALNSSAIFGGVSFAPALPQFLAFESGGTAALDTFDMSGRNPTQLQLLTAPDANRCPSIHNPRATESASSHTEPDRTSGLGKLARKSALVAAGLLTEVEDYPTRIVTMSLGNIIRLLFRQPVSECAITCRGAFRYLQTLDLLKFDFAGKWVLDLGSGHSRFAQMVGALYGDTGTFTAAVDKCVKPRAGKYTLGLKVNAKDIPLASNSFDLIVSLWMFAYYFGDPEAEVMMEEMIRLSKPGGELRLLYGLPAGNEWMTSYFSGHPAVSSIEAFEATPLSDPVFKVKMKDTIPTNAELVTHWQRLEDRGHISVPWRKELFEAKPLLDFLTKFDPQKAGEEDKIKYLAFARRLFHLGNSWESPFLTNEHYYKIHAMAESASSSLRVKTAIACLYLEGSERFSGNLLKFWNTTTNKEKNEIMKYWLSRNAYNLIFRHHDGIYYSLGGEFSEETNALRSSLECEIRCDNLVLTY